MARAARRVSGGIFALALVLAMAGSAAVAAPQGSADVQWAQQQLREKGFDPGRPNGEMTAKTKTALEAFQRSVGLPANGDLDRATIDKLMAGRPAMPTVGNLAAPPHNHDHVSTGRELAPAPHAAPSGRVEAGGVGDQPMLGSGGAPRAAPSGTVSTMAPAPMAGAGVAPVAGLQDGPSGLLVPQWVRLLVIGVIVVIFGGFSALWWLSGRRPARHAGSLAAGGATERHEPSFAAPESPRGTPGLRGERLR